MSPDPSSMCMLELSSRMGDMESAERMSAIDAESSLMMKREEESLSLLIPNDGEDDETLKFMEGAKALAYCNAAVASRVDVAALENLIFMEIK